MSSTADARVNLVPRPPRDLRHPLQAIDARNAAHYWDWTGDAINWTESFFWSAEWFGPTYDATRENDPSLAGGASGGAGGDVGFGRVRGRFADVAVPRNGSAASRNAFDLVTEPYNENDAAALTRAPSVCGMPTARMALSGCEVGRQTLVRIARVRIQRWRASRVQCVRARARPPCGASNEHCSRTPRDESTRRTRHHPTRDVLRPSSPKLPPLPYESARVCVCVCVVFPKPPPPQALLGTFRQNHHGKLKTMHDFHAATENNVHSWLHPMLGGIWSCDGEDEVIQSSSASDRRRAAAV